MINKIFFIGALALLTLPGKTSALDLALGLAAVEQGDDNQRPAAVIHLGWTSNYMSRAYLYGRDFGPVSERTYLLTFARRFAVFKTLNIEASLGLNMLLESISVDNSTDPTDTPKEDNYNFGGNAGLYYAPNLGALMLQLGWDSHLYPAGLNGGLFLATARKHFLSLSCGVRL